MKQLLVPGLMLGALGLASGQAAAVDFYLVAKAVDKTMPDGAVVPMWGFVEDPDGVCYDTRSKAARVTCAEGLPDATVPGPRLNLGPNQPNLRIFLTNLLDAPVSIVIPGQEMPLSNNRNNGPTWTDGSVGRRTDPTQRVRSFGREAAPNGGRRVYRWTNARDNAFRPGIYLYHSGTHPQVQVQMGLYGAVSRNAAAGEAYPDVAFDVEQDLLFSEIDPALHAAAASGNYTACTEGAEVCASRAEAGARTSTLDYHPEYFLINGEPFDASKSSCLSRELTVNDRLLLRLLNAGLRELAPMMLGAHFEVIAEGGRAYQFPREQYSVLLPPGTTKDVMFTPSRAGTFAIIERRLNLTNAAQPNGGMQTCITVAALAGQPRADAGGPGAGTVGSSITFDGSGSSDPDGDPLTYNWDFGDGSTGTTSEPITTIDHVYTDSGTYMVSLVVNDGSLDSAPDVTTATATINDAPVAADNAYSMAQDTTLTAGPPGVLGNDTDIDGDALTAALGSRPSHGSLSLNADGSFVYAPKGGFTGTDKFTYRADDGATDSNVATVTITVNKVELSRDRLFVSWNPNPNSPDGYRVYHGIGHKDSAGMEVIAEVPHELPPSVGPDFRFEVVLSAGKLGLRKGDATCIRLTSFNEDGESGFTDGVCATLRR